MLDGVRRLFSFHFLNPTGNTIHCLQSTEDQGGAQIEGFAQFSAGNLWNSGASTCTFAYYKYFRDDQLQVHKPPYAVMPSRASIPCGGPRATAS